MNYKAHIPAGITFAALGMFVTGMPLDFAMLAGGAIGGALPDIDVKGSSVEKMGDKASEQIRRVAGHGALSSSATIVGRLVDTLILVPFCGGWRWLSEHVFARCYYKIMDTFDLKRRWGWDKSDPSDHRGGLTHSLFGMVLFSAILIPLSLLFGGWALYAGAMLGYLSHLLCDSVCASGVKFFWPWLPNIGFVNDAGDDGRDGIKLLPARMLMKTGKCDTRSELRDYKGTPDYKYYRKYYYLEKGWQWFFKLMMVLLLALIIAGVGPGSGQIAFGDTIFSVDGTQPNVVSYEQATSTNEADDGTGEQQQGNGNVSDTAAVGDASDDATDNENSEGGSTASDTDDGIGRKIAENGGPTSLTYGDLDATTLPKGIIKLPDETLWVVGIGPVNRENLDDPSLSLTQDEKDELLVAATAQRVQGIPDSIADGVDDFANGVGDAVNSAAEGAEDAVSSGSNGLMNLLDMLTFGAISDSGIESGGDLDNWGFLGLTPYTN